MPVVMMCTKLNKLLEACISAQKMGILPSYTRDISPLQTGWTKSQTVLLHQYMTPQNFVHHTSPFGIITFHFPNFSFYLGACFTLWIIFCTPLGHDFQNLSCLHNPEGLCFLLIFNPNLISRGCPFTLQIIECSVHDQYS